MYIDKSAHFTSYRPQAHYVVAPGWLSKQVDDHVYFATYKPAGQPTADVGLSSMVTG